MDEHYRPPAAALAEPEGLKQRRLPFLSRYPIIAGVLFGIVLRLAYSGRAGGSWSAMASGFIFAAPFAVGALTVYLAERQCRRGWSYYFGAPALATTLVVCGTLAIMVEGIICAILIVPFFAVLGGLGGLVMGIVCRTTGWPRQAMAAVAALPLLLGLLGDLLPRPDEIGVVERDVRIAAAPAVVWQHLNAATDIRPDEVGGAWAFRIGAPMPVSGVTRETPEGRVRATTWGRQVHFDELVADADWQPERRIRWTYRYSADSFPPGSLDDHVEIGGPYFDLLDTTYTLEPDGAGTRLRMRVSYRVSTQFNFYAGGVAKWLLGDFGEVILRFYKNRSEAQAQRAVAG